MHNVLTLGQDDSGLTITSDGGKDAWLSGGIEIPDDQPWKWDCSVNKKVRVANLTNLLDGYEISAVQSVRYLRSTSASFEPGIRIPTLKLRNGATILRID